MAEWTVGTFFYFARGFHRCRPDAGELERLATIPSKLDETVCVIGAGGIGQMASSARDCMRVIGTRRTANAPLDGFDAVYTPDKLLEILPEADFVSVCCCGRRRRAIAETLAATKDGPLSGLCAGKLSTRLLSRPH